MQNSLAPATFLHVFPTFGYGGAQIRTIDLINNMQASNTHIIVPLDGNITAAERIKSGADVRFQHIPWRHSKSLDRDNLGAIRMLMGACQPDLLLTYNWGAIDAAIANRIQPLARHLHFEDGFGPEEINGRQLKRRIWARRLALSGHSRIVLPSKTLERIARERWRFKASRLHYIPNGIDCERFATPNTDKPSPFRRSPEERLIGTLGTLRAEKNVARLIKTIAAMPDRIPHRLVIIGDGPERPALKVLAASMGMGDRIHFTGKLHAPETVLGQLDVFALTSDTEQMPYALIEAMAAGLAIAATDVGDVRMMLPPPSRCFVTKVGDDAALQHSLEMLLDPAFDRATLGRLNQEHARAHFDRSRMFESYKQLFQQMILR